MVVSLLTFKDKPEIQTTGATNSAEYSFIDFTCHDDTFIYMTKDTRRKIFSLSVLKWTSIGKR